MKTLAPKEGVWIMVEEPIEQPTEQTQSDADSFHDFVRLFS
jgi:hypothetical protein